jgi:hypothetical protein
MWLLSILKSVVNGYAIFLFMMKGIVGYIISVLFNLSHVT